MSCLVRAVRTSARPAGPRERICTRHWGRFLCLAWSEPHRRGLLVHASGSEQPAWRQWVETVGTVPMSCLVRVAGEGRVEASGSEQPARLGIARLSGPIVAALRPAASGAALLLTDGPHPERACLRLAEASGSEQPAWPGTPRLSGTIVAALRPASSGAALLVTDGPHPERTRLPLAEATGSEQPAWPGIPHLSGTIVAALRPASSGAALLLADGAPHQEPSLLLRGRLTQTCAPL